MSRASAPRANERIDDFIASHPVTPGKVTPDSQLLRAMTEAIEDHTRAIEALCSYAQFVLDTGDDEDVTEYVTLTDDVYETGLAMQIATENLMLAKE